MLRVETTINDPTQFRVLRVKDGHRVWCPMRKGVANLGLYYQIGRQANERYLDALAAAHDNQPGIAVLHRHTKPITNRGRRHPRLNPVSPLRSDPLPSRHGRRAHHRRVPQPRHHPPPPPQTGHRRHRSPTTLPATSRLITKLRGHGLIAKVPRQRLYRVTPYGQRFMTTAITIHDHTFPAAWEATA